MDLTTSLLLVSQIALMAVLIFVNLSNKKINAEYQNIIDKDWKIIKELLNDIVELNLKIDKLQNKIKPGPN